MPNGPSRNGLKNRCTIYPYVTSQDDDAGNNPASNYPAAFFTAIPCSAQNLGGVREVERQGRVSTVRTWLVVFGFDPAVKLNDRIDVLTADGASVANSLFVDDNIDAAGRGCVFEIPCIQVL